MDCGSSKTTGEWDYNAWNVKLDNIQEGSRCKLLFTSNLSEAEYNKYIEAGVAYRRNTYRGKDITELWGNGKLYDQIKDGTFADIYVGDYIKANNVTWLIADLDNYLYTGSPNSLTQHHATIIPATYLTTAKMNESGGTEGGYYESDMVKTTLPNVLETYIRPAFKDHIIQYRNILSNKVNIEATNRIPGTKGASSANDWYDRELDLMSEVNVYGTTVASSGIYDTGIDNRQYAIFRLKPEFINSYGTSRYWYWLKDVASSIFFAGVYADGVSYANYASSLLGIRPRFLID